MNNTPSHPLPPEQSETADSGAKSIAEGRASLGIELGSTRIKAVLVDPESNVLASGGHHWENELADGLWSYPDPAIWEGLQGAYSDLVKDVQTKYGIELERLAGLGVSAMMHGYLAIGKDGNVLVPFRTWRNVNTAQAVEELSPALQFNIPHRWSVSHLYQAVLNGEEHLPQLDHINTLAGLVHERLSGRCVLGIGDASGMFPIDSETLDFDQSRLDLLSDLLRQHGFETPIRKVLPKVLVAGQDAGELTTEGAALLDPSGTLQPGCPMCPPEGDAGTGMMATNSIKPHTGNVSAGTSIFAMVVLERALARLHPELDMVTTPDGLPVAMVHSNNGTSEWDHWVGVFYEFAQELGVDVPRYKIYDLLYAQAFKGDPDGSGLLAYNFLSGEPVLGLESGRPLFTRTLDSRISLPDFMRVQLMTIFGVLRVGMDILAKDEGVEIESLFAHGGLFKTPIVAQQVMADALDVPVEVDDTAGEGGAWGIALLAQFRARTADGINQTLQQFLSEHVFANSNGSRREPTEEGTEGFNRFMEIYHRGLPITGTAGECI